jgi:hypothetical protein
MPSNSAISARKFIRGLYCPSSQEIVSPGASLRRDLPLRSSIAMQHPSGHCGHVPSGIVMLFLEYPVHEGHRDRALTHGGCHTLDMAAPDITDREHPRQIRFERVSASSPHRGSCSRNISGSWPVAGHDRSCADATAMMSQVMMTRAAASGRA